MEVSGKNYFDFNGLVNTTAARGKTGTLLLDPDEIDIEHSNVSGNDSLAVTGASSFTNNSNSAAILTDYTINNELNTTNVTVTTSSGDIDISNANGAVAIFPAVGAIEATRQSNGVGSGTESASGDQMNPMGRGAGSEQPMFFVANGPFGVGLTFSRSLWSAIREKSSRAPSVLPGNRKCRVFLTERRYCIRTQVPSAMSPL